MQDFERDCMPNMQTMGTSDQMCPMMAMQQQQLEAMQPKIYHIINPKVVQHCDMMDMTYGPMHTPTREQLDAMTDDIYTKVEKDVDAVMKQDPNEPKERQFGFGGRGLLRGLIGILLIRELQRRRRRPFFGHPYYGGGYGIY